MTLIDPAIYFGDPWTDLAMLFLFSPTNEELIRLYSKNISVAFKEKNIFIYQLYHIMNHVNIFGSSYINQMSNIIKKIIE